MDATDGFADALIRAPLGATLLAALESGGLDRRSGEIAHATSPAALGAALEMVERMSFGELVEIAVRLQTVQIGPWLSGSPGVAASAYRDAATRRPLADALSDRFAAELHRPVDPQAQQWWTDDASADWLRRCAPLFREFDHVYGAGQFTWAGLWTVTDPPPQVRDELAGVWELEVGPVRRWSLPAHERARVFEVHRADDWARLVIDHPRDGAPHPEWELPGPNQRLPELAGLLAVPGQRAARASIRRHLVPDWRSVAERYDGVHLSWAGLLTAEGCVTDLGGGDVTLLRYWFGERTHWLADVFGNPAPLDQPAAQHPADVEVLRGLLGR